MEHLDNINEDIKIQNRLECDEATIDSWASWYEGEEYNGPKNLTSTLFFKRA